MPRRIRAALIAVMAATIAVAGSSVPANAREAPPGAISGNVRFVANIPELKSAIALAFMGDTMFASTVHGVYSYDISDPAAPRLMGALPMYIWENEDMTFDKKRNLLFVARDPRGFTSPATPGSLFPYGAVHIIDVSTPSVLRPVNSFPVPAGHTTTCINGCDYLWTSGPAASLTTQSEWDGRPIFATNIRNPMSPKHCPRPIDTKRNDGVTDYVHDVQVDANGIAWVSGRGGIRGYYTSGRHRDPVTGKVRKATGCNPIPYAGGGTPEGATPSRFMHNSWHNPKIAVEGRRGDVLFGTEEEVTSVCETSGRFATYDLKGSYRGEGFKNIDKTHFRMRALDTWTPEGAKGADGCASAHYFSDRGDGVLAYAFYNQGVRFLDASNPKDIQQIGFFRADDANSWAAYWHKGFVFIPDFQRGVDIVKFKGRTGSKPLAGPLGAPGTQALEFDPETGFTCPLPQA